MTKVYTLHQEELNLSDSEAQSKLMMLIIDLFSNNLPYDELSIKVNPAVVYNYRKIMGNDRILRELFDEEFMTQVDNYVPPAPTKLDILSWCAGIQYNQAKEIKSFRLGDEVRLVRDLKNRKDKYAVKIFYQDFHIGFIQSELSQMVSELIDSGRFFNTAIVEYNEDAKPYHRLQIWIFDKSEQE